jgi:hypothetical protein
VLCRSCFQKQGKAVVVPGPVPVQPAD